MIKGIDYTGISVVFYCHDGNGRVLMHKRSQNCRDEQGCWDIGGGGLEFGEKIEDGVVREIKEEYCTDVLNLEFLGFRDVHRNANGKKTHWVAFDYKARVDPVKIANGDPHKIDEIKWYSLDTLPTPLHSQLPKFRELYKNKL